MARTNAHPKVTGAAEPSPEPAPPETVTVDAEPEPENVDRLVMRGGRSLVTIKPDTEGERVKVRILRDCHIWSEGDTPEVHAEYGRQLIANGLAEEAPASRPAPKGKAKA